MKFYSKDPVFFSDVSQELQSENESVCVGHLSSWDEFSDQVKDQWIVVDDSLEPKELVKEIYTKGISHLVQKNSEIFSQDLRSTGVIIENPDQYFQSSHSLIGEEVLVSAQLYFAKRDDKDQLFKSVYRFLDQIKSTSAKEAAVAAIEELYMNAIIDAPKESKRLGLPTPEKPSELYLAFNNDTLQISCTDPFGSLDLKKLFGRMYEVYQNGAGEVINMDGTSGAGIGCFLLLEQCRALIFGVRRGIQTKVSCLIPLTASYRQRSKIRKSLHGFEV